MENPHRSSGDGQEQEKNSNGMRDKKTAGGAVLIDVPKLENCQAGIYAGCFALMPFPAFFDRTPRRSFGGGILLPIYPDASPMRFITPPAETG